MFDISMPEFIVCAIIGLLVLGPQRLPKVAAEIGKWVGRARRTATQLRRQLEREIELSELEKPPPPPPPPPAAPSAAPREGDVPDGPGTHADPLDSSAAAPPTPSPAIPPASSPSAPPAEKTPPS